MENTSKIKNKINGFTLIEVLVALLMVSIAFMGIYSATAKYTQQTNQVKDIYVASLLGQEGIEIVRNIRDKNWFIDNTHFRDGLTLNGLASPINCSCDAVPTDAQGCQADYSSIVLTADYATPKYFYIENGNGFYTYTSGASNTLTSYKRRICINEDTSYASSLLHVSVYVYWKGGRSTVIKEDLYNWKW